MAIVAYTQIIHGADDGTVITIEEGSEVAGLPEDVIASLKELGVIGPPQDPVAVAKVSDALAVENAELRAQLAELRARPPKEPAE